MRSITKLLKQPDCHCFLLTPELIRVLAKFKAEKPFQRFLYYKLLNEL